MVDSLTIINRWSDESLEGAWPTAPFTELNKNQKYLVEVNAEILCDRERWNEVLEKFQKMMTEVFHTDGTQEEVRDKYTIRFSNFDFTGKNTNFTDYIFPCNVDFCGAKFGDGNVSFRNAKFMGKYNDFSFVEFGDGNVNFNSVQFTDGDVIFKKTNFGSGDVNFSNTNFGEGEVDFNSVKFENGKVDFSSTIFGKGDVNFGGVEFGEGNVKFSNAFFGNGNVFFLWSNFGEGDVYFNNSIFGEGDVIFHGAEFGEGEISFKETKFGEGNVRFWEVNFGDGAVQFNRAVFGKGNTSFRRAEFGEGGVSFKETKFGEGSVYFREVNFGKGIVNFEDVDSTKGNFSFAGAKFGRKKLTFERMNIRDGYFYFRINDSILHYFNITGMTVNGNMYVKANFHDKTIFKRITVTESASFSGSIFKYKVPDFRDAVFQRPPEVSNMEVPPPKFKKKLWWQQLCFRRAADEKDVEKYRKLKSMASAAHDHEKDVEFFAYEMMAKRGQETDTFWGLLFNTLYYSFSGYGQSFLRPMSWMISSFLSFGIFYCCTIFIFIENWKWSDVGFASLLSLRNVLPIGSVLSRFSITPEEHVSWFSCKYKMLDREGLSVDWITVIGVFQNIFGVIFLFLFLLVLRNKFRLK